MNLAAYPTVMPTPVRLSDGSVLAQDGTLIPFAASCPPDTSPDPAARTCVPFPGARNVNYECGGALVPLSSSGCAIAHTRAASMFEVEALTASAIRPAWSGCNCEGNNHGGGAAAGNGSTPSSGRSHFDGNVACFVLALAIGAAVLRLRD